MNWVDASGREPKRDLTRCVTKITALRVAPTQDGVTPQVTLPFSTSPFAGRLLIYAGSWTVQTRPPFIFHG